MQILFNFTQRVNLRWNPSRIGQRATCSETESKTDKKIIFLRHNTPEFSNNSIAIINEQIV